LRVDGIDVVFGLGLAIAFLFWGVVLKRGLCFGILGRWITWIWLLFRSFRGILL